MTKRYFYTDPLAVAWMIDKFGMQIPIRQKPNTPNNGRCYKAPSLFNHVYGNQNRPERYYIHPDSLHLLTPQPTDIVRIGTFFTDWGSFHLAGTGKVIATRHGDIQDFTIIQRNGLAFHWPESEAA